MRTMHWLDAVRFADTAGFHGDNSGRPGPIAITCCAAFRENKPFDQFTREHWRAT